MTLRFHVNREGISYWIHGRDIPCYPASHGCARVSNAAIDMIWRENLMPDGLRVLVRD